MRFYQMKKKFISSDSDYVLESLSEFETLLPYLYKKIEGSWKIIFVDLKITEVRRLSSELDIPDYIDIEVYLKKDVLILFFQENPSLYNKDKSKWEQYMEVISEFPKLIDKKASSEIFKRCRGDIDQIKEILSEILLIALEEDEVTVNHVNAVILPVDTVYAKDVLFSFLLKNNNLIERRGNKYSRYKNSKPFEAYNKLEYAIGKDIAFYAMQKAAKKLYESKLAYLKNETVDDADLMSIVDIYDLSHAYLSFYLSSPKQTLAVLYSILNRSQKGNNFNYIILEHYK